MLMIGIAGGTGSGKTAVVNKITEQFPQGEVAVLSHDSYYFDNSNLTPEERRTKNYDHPDSIEFDLMINHIKKLKNGEAIYQPIYLFITCSRQNETKRIDPKKVLIVESILCLTNKFLRNLMDIKVYVDCDPDIRLSRVILRDIKERGRNIEQVLIRYENTFRPSHLQFIEPSKHFADIIIPQGGLNQVAINILTNHINQILNKK